MFHPVVKNNYTSQKRLRYDIDSSTNTEESVDSNSDDSYISDDEGKKSNRKEF